EEHLLPECHAGACIPFGHPAPDSWEAACAGLPEGWRPDLLVVPLAYQAVPAWVWAAPVPLVGLAADAQDQWHAYRRALPLCDLVLADAPTVERLHRQGIAPPPPRQPVRPGTRLPRAARRRRAA